jgi:hypothetical protein
VYRAGATRPDATSELGTREAGVIAQVPEQRHRLVAAERFASPVDGEFDRHVCSLNRA